MDETSGASGIDDVRPETAAVPRPRVPADDLISDAAGTLMSDMSVTDDPASASAMFDAPTAVAAPPVRADPLDAPTAVTPPATPWDPQTSAAASSIPAPGSAPPWPTSAVPGSPISPFPAPPPSWTVPSSPPWTAEPAAPSWTGQPATPPWTAQPSAPPWTGQPATPPSWPAPPPPGTVPTYPTYPIPHQPGPTPAHAGGWPPAVHYPVTGIPAPPPGTSPELWRLLHPITVPPPRKRRRWIRNTSIAAAVAVAVLVGVAIQGSGSAAHGPSAGPTARVGATATGAAVTPSPTGPPTVDDMLAAQSAALVGGHLKGFLAPLAHADAKTVTLYKRLFANLRGLHVARWDQSGLEDGSLLGPELKGTITEDVQIEYCLGDANCSTTTTVDMELKLKAYAPAGGGAAVPTIVSAAPPAIMHRLVPPWALASLSFRQRGRVIVAASSAEKSRLSSTLTMAVKAAAAADAFAHWGKPTFYVLYLASSSEFNSWFSARNTHNAIGITYSLSTIDDEVTVRLPLAATNSGPGGLEVTIQHEFGHVATMHGSDPESDDLDQQGEDSFIEGIADLCGYGDNTNYAWELQYVRNYVRGGKWSGSAYLTKEFESSSDTTVAAGYGIGYLAMKRLVEKYGMDKALNFWGAVEHDSRPLAKAASEELGQSWVTVNADIKAYIKKTVHA